MIYRVYYMIAAFMLMSHSLMGQSLTIHEVALQDSNVVITYDLRDSLPRRSYTVKVYASSDQFLNPLTHVLGDVGLDIKPAMNHKIIIDIPAEWGKLFAGSVAFELRAREFIPFISTSAIDGFLVFRRKQSYELSWTGGTEQNVLNFELVRNNKTITSFPNIANVGHHVITFPGYVHPGKGYQLRISDNANQDEVVMSQPFEIRRRVPLLLKGGLGAMLAATAFVIIQNQQPIDENIPDPPTKQ